MLADVHLNCYIKYLLSRGDICMEKYLINIYGEYHGKELYKKMLERLRILLANIQGKSQTQMKTLKNTIMPRIALYQIIQEEKSKEEAYRIVKEYMINVVCKAMKKKYLLAEKLPLFSFIFKKIFISNVMKSDNWEADCVRNDKNGFKVIIHKCLWYDACVENGCPELTRIFCECDDINYGSFHKIVFSRMGSIGMGSNMCDFQFSKEKLN